MAWLWMGVAMAIEVVVIGDQVSDANDMYRMLDSALKAGVDRTQPVQVLPLVGPDRTLSDHAGWLGEKAEYIATFGAPRDVLVLQEEAELAITGGDPTGAVLLAQSGLRLGATPMLLDVPAPLEGLDGDAFPAAQDRLDATIDAYATAVSDAVSAEVVVVPVGEAWRAFYEDSADPLAPSSPFARLYDRNGLAPSPQGTFLIAGLISASITGRSPTASNPALSDAEEDKIRRLVERLVFSDPFAQAHAWAWEWEAWEGSALSDPFLRPWVRVDAEAQTDALDIGTTHERIDGQGLLEIVDGGVFTGTTVRVGQTGTGDLLVRGGVVNAEDLVVGAESGSRGRVIVEGGELSVERLLGGLGTHSVLMDDDSTLEVRSLLGIEVEVPGRFVAGPDLRVRGSLLTAGEVVLDASGVVQVDDRAVLAGSLVVLNVDESAEEIVLLRAARIEGAQLEASVPNYTVATRRDQDGRQEMYLERIPVDDTVSPSDPGEACGCSNSGSASWWFLLALVSSRSRRRSGTSTAE